MRKYGPIYGDIYIAKTAPASNPEQVFFGRAMQTGSISDDYWKIIFQEDLLREPRKVCSAADYIQSYTAVSYTHLIERGDHDELLAMKGRYYELYTGMQELD